MTELRTSRGTDIKIGCDETVYSYCLALVEWDDGYTEVLPYNLAADGGIEANAVVVPRRKCPKCGFEMVPYQLQGKGEYRYRCRCGKDVPCDWWMGRKANMEEENDEDLHE
ncbi:MAG: hypothetical protein LUG99_09170 [Lachnospiraceae bacterium]|nr:hypothetical protein [Lachnospiraceae bacterium]